MKTQLTKIALSVAFVLAFTFTISCSDDEPDPCVSLGGGGGGSGSDISDYRTVKIGSQVWMAENFNFNLSGSMCYKNQECNCATLGRFYDWVTAMALPDSCYTSSCTAQITAKHRGICPSGWHIPSVADWDVLVNYAGGTDIAGARLKYNGSTDEYGFAALLGGRSGAGGGNFNDAGYFGGWWSTAEKSSYSSNDYRLASYLEMRSESNRAYQNDYATSVLLNVRCLKD
jgi:uncharacterized protein (TIGR02145 family)